LARGLSADPSGSLDGIRAHHNALAGRVNLPESASASAM
jgi:hypothetical protein